MIKKLKNLFNKIDYIKLNDFQKTLFYLVHSGNIRKV